ncbi:MAG TPA: carboxypeptidase-like regulatory domain-containing protein [Acidobacteriaceae bacterium]|nr:carboxypeptidase-like regulatory domain-containing protein [Acidobacteriaceae bacterium]
MKCAAVFIATFSFALVAQPQQPKTGQITGHVSDPVGAVIGNAGIYVRGNAPPSEKVELVGHTDRFGNFTLRLPAGAFDIVITALGFESKVQTILVKPDKTTATQWKLTIPKESCDFPGMNCDTFGVGK